MPALGPMQTGNQTIFFEPRCCAVNVPPNVRSEGRVAALAARPSRLRGWAASFAAPWCPGNHFFQRKLRRNVSPTRYAL